VLELRLETKDVKMSTTVYELIDARINTINFELANYDSEFVRKDIPSHLKSSFKHTYFNEKRKELLFLNQMINLIEDDESAV
jgi:hypothetical protein